MLLKSRAKRAANISLQEKCLILFASALCDKVVRKAVFGQFFKANRLKINVLKKSTKKRREKSKKMRLRFGGIKKVRTFAVPFGHAESKSNHFSLSQTVSYCLT
jgi:hypothetical protein